MRDKGKHGEARGDKARQDLGKAGTSSNTCAHVGRQWETMGDNESNGRHWENGRQGKTRTCEGRHTIQHRHTYAGRQWGDKTSGRRTHLPTQAHMCHNGRQGETRLREGGHSIQHRHTYAGRQWGDKGRQDFGKNTGTHVGRQGETMGRQDLGKANTPSNTGTHACATMGGNGRQGETRLQEGGRTIQQRHTYVGRHWETRGDKTLGRRTQHPTQAHMWGDNGRQAETRPWEGGRSIQHGHTCGKTMGDKRKQGETRPGEGGHTIQQAHM